MRLNVVEAGEGPPVVLLHGLFGSGQNWGGIQRQLATRHRVLAIDLRNHGASPRAAAMDYPAMAADVAETMAGVTAAPAAVLGHSMGGKVAMVLALQEPQLVSRLVVADIAPIRYPPALRAYVEAMQAITLRPGLTRRDADAALAETIPEPGIRAFLLQNLRLQESPPDWRLGLAEIAAAMPGIEGFPELPGRYAGPVLVLAGERSGYVRPASTPGFEALFPDLRFATVAGAGHWLHAENPAGFLAALEPFLG
ncbi:alpha/beta fold hydrolase [Paeniroseomonas aquatica]|uniref:Alpha/beta fold hydrolase n=1 Tax=Paeniroseomonas aquatica TaxID=373043 RepID=A0ABT8ADH3_9PROT|nr:alpha/beta fold hydrolase [Paeniroseomonas aquatica]MDN3567887.1 alpha/beta fold hydrolase [Paeniroseomonas aquatica]